MVGNAEVLDFNGNYFFLTYSISFSGMIGDGPRTKVENSCSQKTLGQMVSNALSKSRKGLPAPTAWEEISKKGLNELGAKSWKEVEKKGRYINIEKNTNEILVIPLVFNKKDGNYDELENEIITLSSEVDEETLGKAIQTAFDKIC